MSNCEAWGTVERAQVKAIQLQSLLDVYNTTFMDVKESDFKLVAETSQRQMSDLANLAFDLIMQINRELAQAVAMAYAAKPAEQEAAA